MIGTTVSHYEVLELLGGGGMGIVYKARDVRLGRLVALKFLPPELTRDPEARERFSHEARAASALQHNNICVIHDIDETGDGRMFIVMDFYEGETLRKRIERGPLPASDAAAIALQIARGLAKAHEQGIVHRDIKPANIITTPDGTAKILDFGLAKLAQTARVTREGTTLGTIAYMSPEQTRGEPTDARTDIWSLGVVLYEMLTGLLPFRGDYPEAIIYALLNQPPLSVDTLQPGIPQGLPPILDRMLSKDPANRFARAQEVVSALSTIAGPLAQRLAPAPILERLRRHWKIMLASTVALVAIVAGVSLLTKPADTSITSITVLPFVDRSGDLSQEYFSDGLTEALIIELQKIKALRTAGSRTTLMRYKKTDKSIGEIADELDVQAVVEASVQRSGNDVRVAVELVQASPERILWANTFDRSVTNILQLQSEIARAIAREIKIVVTPEETRRLTGERPVDPEAFNDYLKGLACIDKLTESSLYEAISLFNSAVQRDSQFAYAYLGRGFAYDYLTTWGWLPPSEGFPKAKQEALRAIEKNETLADAHVIVADMLMSYEWDWKGAEPRYQRALELSPNSSRSHGFYSYYLSVLGRGEEAIAECKRAVELDPLSLQMRTNLGHRYFIAGRMDEALAQCRSVVQTAPEFPLARYVMGEVYLHQRQFDRAEEALRAYQRVLPGDANAKAFEAILFAESGRERQARVTLAGLLKSRGTRHVMASFIARAYLALGESDSAFVWLDRAVKEHDTLLIELKHNPGFAAFQKDPRIHSVYRAIGME